MIRPRLLNIKPIWKISSASPRNGHLIPLRVIHPVSYEQLIIRVSDQLKAGEIRLIETTPEESAEAKKRLDSERKKQEETEGRP